LANDALRLCDVDAFYGDSHALHRVSFGLAEGRLLGLLGRNGAGKSTCMNVAVGLLPPRTGAVELFGAPVTRLAPEDIAARGVALVPQGRRIFKSLTVRENLTVAARRGARSPDGALSAFTRVFNALWRNPGSPFQRGTDSPQYAGGASDYASLHPGYGRVPAGRPDWSLETVFAMFPRLGERRRQMAVHLSGGEQQMLAIGRALMANPRVLLLDEPSEGLAPQIVAEVMATIHKLKECGLSIVLVEQNPKLVFGIADDIVILDSGQVVAAGPAGELREREGDLRQHLGVF
jgi:branched-chain amino acid transport system ATP-binding protein